ncbi:hypothetical protein CCHR01_16313 [Colletotrichum chrysophilum]|uniref:Uncharacterized protein n=1 Tax=Colletotrichum chrysophilum TaxID=1836956 RepID=A0AAD9A4M2_9PEZI|nr:hypothetical protein CCHR01_16313 [Colletotrichum chrysophilum]
MSKQRSCGPEGAGSDVPSQQPAEKQADGATGSENVGGETSDNFSFRAEPPQQLENTPHVRVTPEDIRNARMANPKVSSLTDDQLRAFLVQIKQRQWNAINRQQLQNQAERD